MKHVMYLFEDLFSGVLSAYDFALNFPHELCLNYKSVEIENYEIADYMNEVFPELCDEIGHAETEEVYKAFIEKVRVEYEKIQVMLAEPK